MILIMNEEERDGIEFTVIEAYSKESHFCKRCDTDQMFNVNKMKSLKSGYIVLERSCSICCKCLTK